MTELVDYLRWLFDVLYSVTSNETTGEYIRVYTHLEDNVYADTRPSGTLYSITSTQPGEGTYATDESANRDTGSRSNPGTSDCEDPQTSSRCCSAVADD